ncbi:MAG: hypothetical protein FWD17_10970, partial [Polyangiaceae bacterium]|nr:hypothetical protein [Polyangiaceae bacterium]
MLTRHRTGLALLALCACSSTANNQADRDSVSSGGSSSEAGNGGNSGSTRASGNGNSGSSAAAAGGNSTSSAAPGSGNSGSSGGASTGSGASDSDAGVVQDGGSGGSDSGSTGCGDAGIDAGECLFKTETFAGNGRTCVTCHTAATGTISPDEVESLYQSNPNDPLFRSIDSDDGGSDGYTILRQSATISVTIDLPSGVHLASDPNATSVTLRRAIPTTFNTPALDPNLMWDGRQPDLPSQALSAIQGHAQGTITPTMDQLNLIADYEKTLFSSDLLRQYAAGGTTPDWPQGTTDSETRGRRWFAPDSAAPRFNICGQCHGGPMTNETQSNSGLTYPAHFQTVNVSEFNLANNPTYDFTFPDPKNPGQTIKVTTPDPGRALITGDYNDLDFFKITPLWGIKNTAPYFHDNSAATLDDVMKQYDKHMETFLPCSTAQPNCGSTVPGTADYPNPHVPSDQD